MTNNEALERKVTEVGVSERNVSASHKKERRARMMGAEIDAPLNNRR